jgi:hypothetical protein
MPLEVMFQLLGRHIDAINHLLVVWVVLLGSRKHFTEVEYRALYLLAIFFPL